MRDILANALGRGYDGGISIEPHVAVVFHDAAAQPEGQVLFDSFVRYGRELASMIAEIKAGVSG